MNYLKTAWTYMNGKKTIIGAILLLVGTAASGAIPPIPAIITLHHAIPYLLWAGTALGGTGLAHKVIKLAGTMSTYPTA